MLPRSQSAGRPSILVPNAFHASGACGHKERREKSKYCSHKLGEDRGICSIGVVQLRNIIHQVCCTAALTSARRIESSSLSGAPARLAAGSCVDQHRGADLALQLLDEPAEDLRWEFWVQTMLVDPVLRGAVSPRHDTFSNTRYRSRKGMSLMMACRRWGKAFRR